MSLTTNRKATRLDAGLIHPETQVNASADNFDKRDGFLTKDVAGSAATIILTEDEQLYGFIKLTGARTANLSLKIDITLGFSRQIVIWNATSGAYTVTVLTSAGGSTGIVVTQGYHRSLYHDGTNVYGMGMETVPTSDAWASWTPTWTNLSVGNGTVIAKFSQIGKTVFCRLSIVFGSTTSISGSVSFSLPVTEISYGGIAGITSLGMAGFYDASPSGTYQGGLVNLSTTTAALVALDASGTYLKEALLSSTVPFTWTTGDAIAVEFVYEAA